MKLLKGKKIADKILSSLKKEIKKSGIKPGLAVILVGKNKASETYVHHKKKAAAKAGIGFYLFCFSEKAKEKDIIAKIKKLNADGKISGIIVQLPLPKKYNIQKIIGAIDLQKDADGFIPKVQPAELIQPVFPMAILKLIKQALVNVQPSKNPKLNLRKKAIIISNSKIFGQVMKAVLEKNKIFADYVLAGNIKIPSNPSFAKGENHNPFIKRGGGEGFLQQIKNGDIVISAVGKPGIIKGEMLKESAIVIDGGITKRGKKVFGDVDHESVKKNIGYLSPVPGGVGPVTVACLLENTYLLAKNKKFRY